MKFCTYKFYAFLSCMLLLSQNTINPSDHNNTLGQISTSQLSFRLSVPANSPENSPGIPQSQTNLGFLPINIEDSPTRATDLLFKYDGFHDNNSDDKLPEIAKSHQKDSAEDLSDEDLNRSINKKPVLKRSEQIRLPEIAASRENPEIAPRRTIVSRKTLNGYIQQSENLEKNSTRNTFVITGLAAIVGYAAAKAPKLMAPITRKLIEESRFFPIGIPAVASLISTAVPPMIMAGCGAFAIYQIKHMLNAESLVKIENLRHDLTQQLQITHEQIEANKTELHKQIEANRIEINKQVEQNKTETNQKIEGAIKSITKANNAQYQTLSELMGRVQVNVENTSGTISEITTQLNALKKSNDEMQKKLLEEIIPTVDKVHENTRTLLERMEQERLRNELDNIEISDCGEEEEIKDGMHRAPTDSFIEPKPAKSFIKPKRLKGAKSSIFGKSFAKSFFGKTEE
ncbi:MAG: hypothetical protein JO129_04450 [Candidatus Dependentiae bacterium]|nr:hypothetical protein [Candidatus Dependentiae bacterium]